MTDHEMLLGAAFLFLLAVIGASVFSYARARSSRRPAQTCTVWLTDGAAITVSTDRQSNLYVTFDALRRRVEFWWPEMNRVKRPLWATIEFQGEAIGGALNEKGVFTVCMATRPGSVLRGFMKPGVPLDIRLTRLNSERPVWKTKVVVDSAIANAFNATFPLDAPPPCPVAPSSATPRDTPRTQLRKAAAAKMAESAIRNEAITAVAALTEHTKVKQ